MRRLVGPMGFLACLAVAATALAQYGHPLKGQWSGDWGPNATTRNRVLLDLDWNGKTVVGTINPGSANAITLKNVVDQPVLPNYDAWTVRMEGAGKDGVAVVIEGKVVNLGAYDRTMSGTWTQGGQKGDFKLTRN
jgi:hypothetical protein